MSGTLDVIQNVTGYTALGSVAVITLAIGVRAISDATAIRGADKRFAQAQSRAFEAFNPTLESSSKGQAKEHSVKTSDKPSTVLALASLFDVYSKQIDKYQAQTQSRATWSFLCAVVSMIAGIVFLICGGWEIMRLVDKAPDGTGAIQGHVLPGSIISVMGGAMTAFITKTFLDIHRTSLVQLNHYFKQPVLSSHILSAQRLADLMAKDNLKERMYEELIRQVIALIAAEQGQSVDLFGRSGPKSQTSASKRRTRNTQEQPRYNGGTTATSAARDS
jgi:hypothetical protein